MNAGFGRSCLAFPEDFFPTEGFAEQLNALYARVVLLEEDRRVAILSLEMTSLPPEVVTVLQAVLSEVCHADECFVCATHTFSAPHVMPDFILKREESRQKKAMLLSVLTEAARQAAQQAQDALQEVRLALGQAACGVNAARDVETPAGWWVDTKGEGMVNHTLTALRIEDTSGRLLGAVVHYPVQSSVLDGSLLRCGGKAVSGDIAGEISRLVEESHPGAVALFLIGAAGDQAPREKAVRVTADAGGQLTSTDKQDAALAVLHALGEEAAQAAMQAIAQASPITEKHLTVARTSVTVPAKAMEHDLHALRPTRIPPYQAAGEASQTIELLTIGDLRLLCVKPELNCVTAAAITQREPSILVVTMVNGGAKYMADAASYDRITYEAMNSPFGKGAAELLAKAARSLVDESRP